MDLKRQFQREGDESVEILAQHSKRRREDNPQQSDTCIIGNSWPLWGMDTPIVVQHLAGLVERIVHEELERRLVPRRTITEAGPSEAKFYKLVFENDLPDTIYTLSKIKAKDEQRLVEIALYDVRNQSIVTAGSLSSTNIEICVLDDDEFGFGSNGSDEDWTTDQFKARILRQRENKGHLLKGGVVIPLKNGVALIEKIMFTDNSSWRRSRHFRLGAFVHSASNAAVVKEAISNRFMVKDTRGEANQKRYPPFLNDPIWRLKRISKGGKGKVHELLSRLKINTVKDLLHIYETNPSLLQEKNGRIRKQLQEAIKHAKTWIPEVTSDGHNYNRSQITPNFDEKRLETGKQHAYRNAEDVFIPANETSAHSFPRPLASLQVARQCGASALQALDLPTIAQKDQIEERQDFGQPSTSTSHVGEAYAACDNQFACAELHMEGNYTFLLEPHVPAYVADDFYNLFNRE